MPELSDTNCFMTSSIAFRTLLTMCPYLQCVLYIPRRISSQRSRSASKFKMYGLDALVARATPPYNVLGSTLFLSYIVLALYFTTSILLSLYRQYIAIFFSANAAKDDKKTEAIKSVRARHINIYAFLSSISFATLSYHMLGFLIASYTNWAGPQGLWETDMTIESLKSWMLETSLFESFAKELVRDGPSTAWTQAAIVGTWFWNIWMAGKGEFRALYVGDSLVLTEL